MKAFKGVRAQRNINLLRILRVMAQAKLPVSIYDIKKNLGVSYSNAHKNVSFLEEKGVLRRLKHECGRKRIPYVITVRGALASLLSPGLSHKGLLKRWREKDWGPGYDEPFEKLGKISELRRFVETIYLHGGYLEDVNEGLLRRGLSDPEQALSMITNATATVRKKIGKDGKYSVELKCVPGSVSTILLGRTKEPRTANFVVMPSQKYGEMLYNALIREPGLGKRLGAYILTILHAFTGDLLNKGKGEYDSIYLPESRTCILTMTLPAKVASSLHNPEQILRFTQKFYRSLIRPFIEDKGFLEGKRKWKIIPVIEYDPRSKILYQVSDREIEQKLRSAPSGD